MDLWRITELEMTSVAGAAPPVQALALPARPALAPPPRPPAGGGPVLAVPLQELALDESWGGVDGDINGSGLGAC